MWVFLKHNCDIFKFLICLCGGERTLYSLIAFVFPLRMRFCCLHLRSATQFWSSAITSPSTGTPLITICANTSSMPVHIKSHGSLSAYICPSPDYWLVGEVVFKTCSDFFFVCCGLTHVYIVIHRLICTPVWNWRNWAPGKSCKWHEKMWWFVVLVTADRWGTAAPHALFVRDRSLSVITGNLWFHRAGRASSALLCAGCTGLGWNVAEKWAFAGEPGTLEPLDAQCFFIFCCLSSPPNKYFHINRCTTTRM